MELIFPVPCVKACAMMYTSLCDMQCPHNLLLLPFALVVVLVLVTTTDRLFVTIHIHWTTTKLLQVTAEDKHHFVHSLLASFQNYPVT